MVGGKCGRIDFDLAYLAVCDLKSGGSEQVAHDGAADDQALVRTLLFRVAAFDLYGGGGGGPDLKLGLNVRG